MDTEFVADGRPKKELFRRCITKMREKQFPKIDIRGNDYELHLPALESK